jgi:predicted RNA-binding Zn ribbon-like protein
MKRICDNDNCVVIYTPDSRNLKRGWGLCCSKSCAAEKREKDKIKKKNKLKADVALLIETL